MDYRQEVGCQLASQGVRGPLAYLTLAVSGLAIHRCRGPSCTYAMDESRPSKAWTPHYQLERQLLLGALRQPPPSSLPCALPSLSLPPVGPLLPSIPAPIPAAKWPQTS